MPPRKRAATHAPKNTKASKTTKAQKSAKAAESYKHSDATSLMRPEVGSQMRLKKKLPPARSRYDDSLAPSMEWDGQKPSRDEGELLLDLIEQASALATPNRLVPEKEMKNRQAEPTKDAWRADSLRRLLEIRCEETHWEYVICGGGQL